MKLIELYECAFCPPRVERGPAQTGRGAAGKGIQTSGATAQVSVRAGVGESDLL